MERRCCGFGRESGLETVPVRLAGAYGTSLSDGPVAQLDRAAVS